MNPRTKQCMDAIVDYARKGYTIHPMFFSVQFGRATVSAAIRGAVKRGLIEQAGLDGAGKPKWQATFQKDLVTHEAPTTIQ